MAREGKISGVVVVFVISGSITALSPQDTRIKNFLVEEEEEEEEDSRKVHLFSDDKLTYY